ncbi:MAG TPA: hypothetical protein VGF36_08045, partial [Rhodopila sp.]
MKILRFIPSVALVVLGLALSPTAFAYGAGGGHGGGFGGGFGGYGAAGGRAFTGHFGGDHLAHFGPH